MIRLPGFLKELPPYQFCDESLYLSTVFQMLKEGRWIVNEFLSGNLNYYIPLFIGKIAALFRIDISMTGLTVVSRFLTTGLFNAAVIFALIAIAELLKFSRRTLLILLCLYTFSPMVVGLNRFYYPDHYLLLPAFVAFYCLLNLVVAKKIDGWWYGIASAAAALLASFKYSGVLYLWLAMGIYLAKSFGSKAAFRAHWKQHSIALIKMAAIFAVVFLLLNPTIIPHPRAFLNYARVAHYQRSNTPWVGWYFYLITLLFTTFGFLGIWIMGYGVKAVKSDRVLLALLVAPPLVVILGLGQFDHLYGRNLLIVFPSTLLLATYGLQEVASRLNRRLSVAILFAVLAIEPLVKIGTSLRYDFLPDSRVVADQWVGEYLLLEASMLSNSGCWQPPVGSDRMLSSYQENPCPRLIALDSWFGGITAEGKAKTRDFSLWDMIREKRYYQIHYLNHRDAWKTGIPNSQALSKLLENYEIIKKFESYGPAVYIYERRKICGAQ